MEFQSVSNVSLDSLFLVKFVYLNIVLIIQMVVFAQNVHKGFR